MVTRYNGPIESVSGIEVLIQSVLGVEAEYVERYDRLQIQQSDRVQSRIDKNNAPTEMVERYRRQMGENTFPPIIVTKDHYKVDGNTRDKAYGLRGQRYVPALVVPVVWHGADDATQLQLLYLSELINNRNGKPLDKEERYRMVETMIKLGDPDEKIVMTAGISNAEVRALRERHEGSKRLERVGIDPRHISGVSLNVLRAFGGSTAMALDDVGYKALAELTKDAALKSGEVKALAASLRECTTEELRNDRLARERQAREPQITARRSGSEVAVMTGRLRAAMSMLLNNAVENFVEHNPERIKDYVDLLRKGHEMLSQIIGQHPSIADLQAATELQQAGTEGRPH